MKLYELGNPSDPYTYYAPDDKVAIAVNLLVGSGATFCIPVDDEGRRSDPVGPLFLFADVAAVESGLAATFGPGSLSGFVDERWSEVADALDTFMIFGPKERKDYEGAIAFIDDPTKREAYRAEVLDRHRSSMNNYGAHAWECARRLRETHAPGEVAP